MYTQCPQCLTIFAIDEDALQASLGIVHCGRCGQRFDALRSLSNSLPVERGTPLAERNAGERVPTLTQAVPPPGPPAMQHRGDAAPTASMPEPEPDLPSAPPAPDAAVAPLPDPPDAGSDWFADFENELTTSLLTDATHAAFDEGMGDYAWQVDELPAQAPFAVPGVSTMFWGSGEELDVFEAMATEQPTHPASEPQERDAPEAAEPAPVRPGARPAGIPEVAGADTDPVPAGEPTHASAPRPVPLSADEVVSGAARPADPEPAGHPAAPDGTDPAPRVGLLLAHDVAEQTGAAEADAAKTAAAETDEVQSGEVTEPPEATPTEVVSDPTEPLAPVYVRPRRRRTAGVAWALGCLVLALVLAAQLAWIKRVDLFRDPATHAGVARACQVIDCRLPPIRDESKLELVSRDVRPDPQASGALMITATVRNNADFRQPWPVVVVELTDLDNNVVAMRRFRPAEYMPDAARRAAGIAAGATSAVAFEVADPGRRAVAFRFSFE
jgi:predicted Zn finger-like uncharacterized protein